MGGSQDEEICRRVADLTQKKPAIACGGSLTQFGALAAFCDGVVVNDGGPLHVAAASGAKTVSIFGSVDEKVYGPYPQGFHKVVTKDLACRPCYRQFRRARCEHISCLNLITVDEVLKEIEEILKLNRRQDKSSESG